MILKAPMVICASCSVSILSNEENMLGETSSSFSTFYCMKEPGAHEGETAQEYNSKIRWFSGSADGRLGVYFVEVADLRVSI